MNAASGRGTYGRDPLNLMSMPADRVRPTIEAVIAPAIAQAYSSAITDTIMSMRGSYGRANAAPSSPRAPVVGISLFHTVGDRDRAAEQVNTEFDTLKNEILSAMGVPVEFQTMSSDDIGKAVSDPTFFRRMAMAQAAKEASPLYPIWRDVFNPIYDEWNKFYADQSSWTQFWTNWEEYERWFERLRGVRNAIKAKVPLASPEPSKLGTTVFADAGGAIKDAAGDVKGAASDVWKTVKYGVWGVLAIGGVIAVSSIVQNLRDGKDPAEKYFALMNRRR